MTAADLYPAALSVARVVRKYGWESDDCVQEAFFVWAALQENRAFLALPTDRDRVRYGSLAVKRHIVRRASRSDSFEPLGTVDLVAVETRQRHDAMIELNDLIDSAPPAVRDYLTLRVIDYKTWEDTRAAIGCSNDTLAAVKRQAADYLLQQYEGVRRA